MDAKIKEALDDVRTAAQELNTAISDAAARHGGAVQADVEAAGRKAGAIAASIRTALEAQGEDAKKHLQLAMTSLAAIQQHADAALRGTGEAFQLAFRQAQTQAQACVKEVNEATAQMHANSATAGSARPRF